jgi:hypothetical protein
MTTTLEERKQHKKHESNAKKNMQQREKSNPTPKKQYAIHKQEQAQCQANNEEQN